jgi:hypothetical protein
MAFQIAPRCDVIALRKTRDLLNRALYDRRNDDLPKKRIAFRREWTKDDVRTLKMLAKQKAGVAKIAKTLKRTPGATAAKAHTMGVSLSTQ